MRLLAQHSEGFDPARPWNSLGTVSEHATRLFTLRHTRMRSPHTDREAVFVRLHCPDWVNVVAVTTEGELLLVEQFRHGNAEPGLEIVGGVCDPGEDDPTVTAARELLEETGHQARSIVPLGWCHPNPAIQDNRCHFFLALDCVQVADLELDPSEELRAWAMDWREVREAIREGRITHALVLNAFYRLSLWEGWPELEQRLLAR